MTQTNSPSEIDLAMEHLEVLALLMRRAKNHAGRGSRGARHGDSEPGTTTETPEDETDLESEWGADGEVEQGPAAVDESGVVRVPLQRRVEGLEAEPSAASEVDISERDASENSEQLRELGAAFDPETGEAVMERAVLEERGYTDVEDRLELFSRMSPEELATVVDGSDRAARSTRAWMLAQDDVSENLRPAGDVSRAVLRDGEVSIEHRARLQREDTTLNPQEWEEAVRAAGGIADGDRAMFRAEVEDAARAAQSQKFPRPVEVEAFDRLDSDGLHELRAGAERMDAPRFEEAEDLELMELKGAQDQTRALVWADETGAPQTHPELPSLWMREDDPSKVESVGNYEDGQMHGDWYWADEEGHEAVETAPFDHGVQSGPAEQRDPGEGWVTVAQTPEQGLSAPRRPTEGTAASVETSTGPSSSAGSSTSQSTLAASTSGPNHTPGGPRMS